MSRSLGGPGQLQGRQRARVAGSSLAASTPARLKCPPALRPPRPAVDVYGRKAKEEAAEEAAADEAAEPKAAKEEEEDDMDALLSV